ncbi:MAG: DUF3050 domain-containing protein [Candidatus Binatia bacterium]|nr:DUF3050 domain-containing protein [Candidatus Binatia bacterium]
MNKTQNWEEACEVLRNHPLYGAIKTPSALRLFTEYHVFAVWDFMTLLKSLQRDLTTVSLPWFPGRDPETARLVNALVLAEESDSIPEGDGFRKLSHFEWYLEAMTEIGADCSEINFCIAEVRRGALFQSVLADAKLTPSVNEFLQATSEILEEPVAVRVAAFHYSRELIIPEMFLPIATNLSQEGLACGTLVACLQRHVDIDSQDHSLASEAMVERLLASSPELMGRAEEISLRALTARVALWDAILERIC